MQAVGGFLAGLGLGAVPGGGVADLAATAAGVVDEGSATARLAKGVGEMVGGAVLTGVGAVGEAGSWALNATGVGAVVGVPGAVASAAVATAGVANVGAGEATVTQALSQGSGGRQAVHTPKVAKEGAPAPIRRVGDSLNTADDVLANPKLLEGMKPQDLMLRLGGKVPDGWRVEAMAHGRHAGEGFMLRQYTSTGSSTGKMIQWHPGGGHHGPTPYWKVNAGHGPVRIGPRF